METIVEYLHFCWYLTHTSCLKIDQLVKTFQIVYSITSFGVINILVYDGWGSNFNTCPNMVNEVEKKCQRIFYIFELLNYKKQSKYRFRQLIQTELQYRIFVPALWVQWQFVRLFYKISFSYRNTRARYEICSKLTIKTPERRQWRLHLILEFTLLTLNK